MDSFEAVEARLAEGWSQNGHKIYNPRDSRKVGNNTYLERRDPSKIALRLHSTDVLTFEPDKVTLDSGSWQTVTTKARFNGWLPFGLRVYSDKGSWYLYDMGTKVCRFFDGMQIDYKGKCLNPLPEAEETRRAEETKAMRARIREYVNGLKNALPLPEPSGGDCWHCLLTTTGGQGLGDATGDIEHLISHMEESYYVPSLVLRALQEVGYPYPEYIFKAGMPEQIGRAVTRYLKARLMPEGSGARGKLATGFAVR